jgi:hypothetical protein
MKRDSTTLLYHVFLYGKSIYNIDEVQFIFISFLNDFLTKNDTFKYTFTKQLIGKFQRSITILET